MQRDYKKWALGLIKGRVLFDVPMRKFTSIKVGGPADSLLFPKDVAELRKVVRYARRKDIPILILGKGTNLIVRDKGIRGWVISLTQGMKKVQLEGDVVEAEAGLALQRLVQFSIQKGLTGARTLLWHSRNGGGWVGDECRRMGCGIEGYPPLCHLDERERRSGGETSAEVEIFLSEIGHSTQLDHSQRTISAEKGKERRDS